MFSELMENVTNWQVFTGSVTEFFTTLSISKVVMSIIVVFMLVGLVDKIRGNKLGYGEKFDEGFQAMGSLALAVVGLVSLSPVLLLVLAPIVTPLYNLIGASPAMFPSSFLALDMGGYALATQLAGDDIAVGQYSGLIVASMMGITISFTIPYALQMIKKGDQNLFATGILTGVVTMPVGCLLGGLAMNFTSTPLSLGALLRNTLPVILLAALVALGMIFNQKLMIRLFSGFGKGLGFIITVSPGIAIFQYLTGLRLPLFSLMVEEDPVLGGVPLEVSLLLVGLIAIVLTGAFPMILFLNRRLGRVMDRFGRKTGINSAASTGLLTQLASSIPVWSVLGDMNQRGKLINIAFAVSGSFVFGDALAFAGGANPEMVFPVILAKLSAGVLAVLLTLFMLNKNLVKIVENPINTAENPINETGQPPVEEATPEISE